MNICDQTPAISRPVAHLLIHADTVPMVRITRFEATLRKLRSLYFYDLDATDSEQLTMQIVNLQGQTVFAIESAEPLVEIALPAGTYHVIAQYRKVFRSYTVAIEPETSFNLYIRFKSRLH